MTDTNALDFSKISLPDMLYFLNGNVKLSSNESLFKDLDPNGFSDIEMYEYIKLKTDNFDKYVFGLFINSLRLFTPMFVRFGENEKGEFFLIKENETDYSFDWESDMKLHEYIASIEKLNTDLVVGCGQIINFSKIAEDLFNTICETKENEPIKSGIAPEPANTQTGTKELQIFKGSKLADIYDPEKIHKEFKKELKCDYSTFKAWFVDSVICDKKMSWNYGNGNKTQLRSFIYNLTYGWKPAETNTAFKITVDSNDRETQINSNLKQRLEKCKKD